MCKQNNKAVCRNEKKNIHSFPYSTTTSIDLFIFSWVQRWILWCQWKITQNKNFTWWISFIDQSEWVLTLTVYRWILDKNYLKDDLSKMKIYNFLGKVCTGQCANDKTFVSMMIYSLNIEFVYYAVCMTKNVHRIGPWSKHA